jgi:hypothetical protein
MRFVSMTAALILGVAACTPAVAPQDPQPTDVNAAAVSGSARAANESAARSIAHARIDQSAAETGGAPLCAVAVIPGPANSFDIRIGLFNAVTTPIDVMIMDSFAAYGGRSLLHEAVFNVVAPNGGTADVSYPSATPGRGPVVIDFAGFDALESSSFNTDPDTYDDPAFGATVDQLTHTSIELVYEGALRCRGELRFDAVSNASIALIRQTAP